MDKQAKQTAENALADPTTSESTRAHALAIIEQAEQIINDPTQQANYDHWKEGGAYRVILHSIVGALSTGNINGAISAASSQKLMPVLANLLNQDKLPPALRQTLILGASALLGNLTGGNSGAGVALTATANNLLTHEQSKELIKLNAKCKQASDCSDEDLQRQAYLKKLNTLSYYKVTQPDGNPLSTDNAQQANEIDNASRGISAAQVEAERLAQDKQERAKIAAEVKQQQIKELQDAYALARNREILKEAWAQEEADKANNQGLAAGVRGVEDAGIALISNLTELPQSAEAIRKFFQNGGTPNQLIGIVAQGSKEEIKQVFNCETDYDCSKATATVIASVIPIERLVGVVKDVKAASKLNEANQVTESVLKYVPTPKYDPVYGFGTKMDLPDNVAQAALTTSISSGNQRYAFVNGKVYKFQYDEAGGWHGYPRDISDPRDNVPASVAREWKRQGVISNAEYKRIIKAQQ